MTNAISLDELILNQISDAVIFADGRGRIARWNRAAAALFGFTPEEILGQSLELIIPEKLRQAHWRGFDAAIAGGRMKLEGRPTLTRALHKTGRKIYIEMTFGLVKGLDGIVSGAVAVARDVTEKIEQQKAAAAAPNP